MITGMAMEANSPILPRAVRRTTSAYCTALVSARSVTKIVRPPRLLDFF